MKQVFTLLALCACASSALAHPGQRFKIQFVNNQLVARGYLDAFPDDGAGVIRPYYNAMHSNWLNNANPAFPSATDWLPGFDLFASGPITGFNLTLTLVGSSKWVNPPAVITPSVVPNLVPLSVGEQIFITSGLNFVSTSTPGSLTLLTNTPLGGVLDLDVSYDIASHPVNVMYVLDFQLSTNAPGVLPSGPIHAIMAPDGLNPTTQLLDASLFLEHFLGQPLCAPDMNKDGAVNSADLATLLGQWGGSGAGDLNGDGVVNSADLAALLGAWGVCL